MTPERAGYEALRRERPELFANPEGAIVEILTDPADVAWAEDAAAARLREAGLPEDLARTGVAYADQYLTLLRDAVRFPDGTPGTYIREVAPGAAPGVAVLPVFDGRVVLVDHFRHALRTWSLEIPRGFGEAGVTPEDSARRELAEEIGAGAVQLTALGHLRVDSAMSADRVALFHAEIDRLGDLDTAEGISGVRLISVGDLAEMIAAATVDDGYTMAAFLRASLRGLLTG